MDQSVSLAAEFPTPSREQWLASVDKALKGAPFDKKLVTRLYEGLSIQPLYTRADWPGEDDPSGFPGAAPFVRGGLASGAGPEGWDIRVEHGHPEPEAVNAAILEDLMRGATSIHLRIDRTGRRGTLIRHLDDLDRALREVLLDIAPVSLDAGAEAIPAATVLMALWQRRGHAPDRVQGAFNVDPLGTLAATGRLATGIDQALVQMADLAAGTVGPWPQAVTVGVDTSPYYDAGATESQDLAAAMATGVAYLKALTAAGLDVDGACRQILFSLSVGCDQFLSIAKLRAARLMWGRIAEASGASEPARRMRLHARTAGRIMSRRDPWVNMLRTTVAGFAAGVGGADSVTVQPFDAALGPSDSFARRIARNTQILLKEESSLARVIDPAGGSWYVETLTTRLAEVAWREFQAIEGRGGMAAVLLDGSFAAEIAAAWAAREKNIARRKDPLTGISAFPNIHEQPVVRPANTVAVLDEDPRPGLGGPITAPAGAAGRGGPLFASAADGGLAIVPLPRHTLAEAFEALRDSADRFKARTGAWPRVFLANLGPVAQHTGRATFAKNFFEAGGIEALGNSGFGEAAACASAFQTSGASIAVLCGSDRFYETQVATFAPALKAAGVTYLYLAGNPGEREAEYRAAGVDEFVTLGCDALAVLRAAHLRLGVPA